MIIFALLSTIASIANFLFNWRKRDREIDRTPIKICDLFEVISLDRNEENQKNNIQILNLRWIKTYLSQQ